MSTVQFFHAGMPPTATAQQRQHTRAGASYLPASARRARAWYQAVLERHAPAVPLVGPIEVRISWTFGGPRPGFAFVATEVRDAALKLTVPDLDNSAKLLLDAATDAGYWRNDANVARLMLEKYNGVEG